jgi:hypothetical protein
VIRSPQRCLCFGFAGSPGYCLRRIVGCDPSVPDQRPRAQTTASDEAADQARRQLARAERERRVA